MIKGCILPWIHLYGDVKGEYRLCCHIPTQYNKNEENIEDIVVATYKDPISSIWNNDYYKKTRLQFLNNEIPSVCYKACYSVEDLGGESNRQHVNKHFAKFTKLQDHTKEDGSLSTNPIYLDIRFGNKCNFKCRICGPYASSAWFKDREKIDLFTDRKSQLEDYYTDSPDFWNYLTKIKKSIKYFYFAGGEPLIMDGHYKLLQWLIDNNKTDVVLTYNTNLSTLKYKNFDVFDIWAKFDNITLWPSVDGYKDHCKYSRTNFNWDVFEKNLKKARKYVSTISSTISIYSALSTVELIMYFKSMGITTYLSMLDTPEHLDCRLLPSNIKTLIIRKFSVLKNRLNLNFAEEELENINKAIAYLQNDIENKNHLLKRFKIYNEQVDKINNTSFIKIYPELAKWYEKI